MRHRAIATLWTITVAIGGCEAWIDDKGDGDGWGEEEDQVPETTETEDSEPTSCLHEWPRTDESELPITAVCLSGDQTNGAFFDPTIEVPCGTEENPRTLFSAEQYEESSLGEPWMVQAASGGYLCDPDGPDFDDYHIGGGGTWQLRFEPEAFSSCADYLVSHVGYVVLENDQQVMEDSFFPLACPYSNEYSLAVAPQAVALAAAPQATADVGAPQTAAMAAAPQVVAGEGSAAIESAPTACTPGTALFDLFVRDVEADDLDDTVALRLTPVAVDGPARFPERAWLRELVIDDWASLDNLRVAGVDARLHQKGARVWGGHAIESSESAIAFAAGEVSMGAMFASSEATLDPSFKLPQVTLTWTCQVNPSVPHYQEVEFPGYMGPLAASLKIGHRMTVWLDWSGKQAFFAPEGRYGDHIVADLNPISANKATFSGALGSYDASFAGRVTRSPSSIQLDDVSIVTHGMTLPLPPMKWDRIAAGD